MVSSLLLFRCCLPAMELVTRLVVSWGAVLVGLCGTSAGNVCRASVVIEHEQFLKMEDSCTAKFKEWL